MGNGLRLISIVALAAGVMVILTAIQNNDYSASEAGDMFETGFTLGQALVVGIEKSCDHVRDVLGKYSPDQRVLLLTDEYVTKFDNYTCDGECDFLEINNALVACRKEIKGCIVYGGLYKGQILDLSIDAYGKKLSEACRP